MSNSTLTTQQLINYARSYAWTNPILGVAGYSNEPALSFINDVIQKILAKPNPWKFNSLVLAPFYTNPNQQDYPTNISQSVMGWLESATMVDINNPQLPQPQIPVTCVDRLLPTYKPGWGQTVCWIPNGVGQYSTWPGNNMTYEPPLISQGGGPNQNPRTGIRDPNGNIQLVTTFGTTLSSGIPTWPVSGAAPGTTTSDGTVVWTLIDPNGIAIRLDALATFGSNIFQYNLIYQQKPIPITSLNQTLAPLPDDLGYLIKQGFLTYCYKQGDKSLRAQFAGEFQQWLLDIQEALQASDREDQEYGLYPSSPVQGGPGTAGGTGTYGYPGWPNWQ